MPWILPSGKYYDSGNVVAAGSIEVDVRPSTLHDYLSGGVGNTVWAINPQRQAEALRKLADQADVSAAKAEPVIQYLVTHTPQECADYVQTNVTNLATAKDVLAKIAMALCVIAKDKLRD